MMQYAAFTAVTNGDEYSTAFTTDKAKAFKDAEYTLSHLTERERENHEVSVRGWDVPDGMTFEEWTDDMLCIPDPVFYSEV